MATDKGPWIEFHVLKEGEHHCFCHGNFYRQACVIADSFWRESGTDDMVLMRGAAQFDSGTVTTTGSIRHFTGLTRVVPEPGQRWPADMSGPFLSRLCADWLCVGDVLRVHYDPSLFFTRRRNLEVLGSFLK